VQVLCVGERGGMLWGHLLEGVYFVYVICVCAIGGLLFGHLF
jgi:hypothetical protein